MKLTAHQTSTTTLTELLRAADRRHALTITALKEEKDDAGRKTGRLVETVRTVEIFDIHTTAEGDIVIDAMDRETGEPRRFRLDRLISYTLSRSPHRIPLPPSNTPAPPVNLRSPAQLIARELGRDYWNSRWTRRTTALAA